MRSKVSINNMARDLIGQNLNPHNIPATNVQAGESVKTLI